MNYQYKPRAVYAAQWSLERPGDVIGLLANYDTDSRREGEQLLFHDGYRETAVDPGGWVVIDDGDIQVFADRRFHDLFEERNLRGGSVTNTLTGTSSGITVQAGNVHGGLRL